MLPYVLVGVGGALGALARLAVARWVGALVQSAFPLGTFVVNVTGSFLLGLVATLVTERLVPGGDAVRLAVGVGFLGAYTTFSTFEFETHALLEDGAWMIACANVAFSVILGLVALRAGMLAAKSWGG